MEQYLNEEQIKLYLKSISKEQIILALIGFSFSYILQHYIPFSILICFGIILIGISFFIYQQYQKIQNKGYLLQWSEKWQNIFLERSIYDLVADIWYIPGISRYIKAFLRPFFYSIPPEQAIQQFEEINPDFKNFMTRKGIIHMLPSFLRQLLVPKDFDKFYQLNYGQIDQNSQKYRDMLREQRVKFGEVQNKIKEKDQTIQYYNYSKYLKIQKKKYVSANLKNNTYKFIYKFLKGSQYVSSHEKKNLIRACVLTGIYIGANLYYRQKSRQQLKKIVFISISIVAYAICAGSFLLLTTHHTKKDKYKQQLIQELEDLQSNNSENSPTQKI